MLMTYRPPRTPRHRKKVEQPEQCQYHCENGWLPTDGETDMTLDVDTALNTGLTINNGMMLLWPTEWRRCFCSESDLLPEGVVV